MSKQRKATIWLAKLSHWSQYDRIPRVSAAEVSLCVAYGGYLKITVARARSGLAPTLSGGSRAAGGARRWSRRGFRPSLSSILPPTLPCRPSLARAVRFGAS